MKIRQGASAGGTPPPGVGASAAARMGRTKFKVGDKVRVIGYRPAVYPPGVEDEMGTEELFQSMVGRRYTIRGFDVYGHIEIRPKRFHTVWIEPALVELVGGSR